MQTITDASFGTIPIRKTNEIIEVLLVLHNEGHWALPKGHPEIGETAQNTALRETKEEVNLDVEIISNVSPFVEKYTFNENDKQINKTVTYFLAKLATQQKIITQASEIADYRWLNIDEAIELATFPASKQTLTDIKKYLNVNQLAL